MQRPPVVAMVVSTQFTPGMQAGCTDWVHAFASEIDVCNAMNVDVTILVQRLQPWTAAANNFPFGIHARTVCRIRHIIVTLDQANTMNHWDMLCCVHCSSKALTVHATIS